MGVVDQSYKMLHEVKEKEDQILVAFSGGKDSSCLAAMCHRVFSNVQMFFFEFLPGLECVDELLAAWERQYKLKILRYFHWSVATALRYGTYGAMVEPWHSEHKDVEEFRLDDSYTCVIQDTGIQHIATGAKKSDSMWRRRMMGTWGDQERMVYPLKDWNKLDVLGFLKANRIPLPESSGRNANGIDLSTPSLLWLHENHPADFRRVCEVFPLAESVVWRQKFYGIGREHYGNEPKKKRTG